MFSPSARVSVSHPNAGEVPRFPTVVKSSSLGEELWDHSNSPRRFAAFGLLVIAFALACLGTFLAGSPTMADDGSDGSGLVRSESEVPVSDVVREISGGSLGQVNKGIVSIHHDSGGAQNHVCGGLLVLPNQFGTTNQVLTANHCLPGDINAPVHVRVNSLWSKSQGALAIVHSDGSSRRSHGGVDLAVLTLDRRFDTPTIGLATGTPRVNRIDIVAGWGIDCNDCSLTDRLKIAQVRITDNNYPLPGYGRTIRSTQGGNNPGRPCDGDSGGPVFFVNSEGRWAAHGVHVAGSNPTRTCSDPHYAVAVRLYTDFITG